MQPHDTSDEELYGPNRGEAAPALAGERTFAKFQQACPGLMEHENEFYIDNVGGFLEGDKIRSDPFVIGNFRYRVLVFPFGTRNQGSRQPPTLAAFVEADPLPQIDQERWMFHNVKYALTLVNHHDYTQSVHKSDSWSFCKREIDRGWHSFISVKDMLDGSKGWINNETEKKITFRVQCYVRNSESLINIGADYDSKKETGFIGLKNHGATCYLNCLLQTLYNIGKFRKLVYEADTSETAETDAPTSGSGGDKKSSASSSSTDQRGGMHGPPNLLKALQNSFYSLQTNQQAGNCRELMRSFGWESVDAFTQHDYQELNRILLDKVEERLKGTKLDGELKRMFAGEQESYIECTNVNYASKKLEPFYDINLNLKTDDGSWVNNLEDAFRDYVKEEMMEGENAYDASDGGFGKQPAKKGIRFKSLPIVSNLLLKRFIFDLETLDTIKTNDEMQFPRRIDLSEYVPGDHDPAVYTLYGVTVQTGTVSSGHYYCFLRPWQEDGTEAGQLSWIRFDDEQITKVTEYAAMQDNYGGEDLGTFNHFQLSLEQLKEKKLPERNGWPQKQIRMANAYILVYIRKDHVEDMLKPPKPTAALRERIEREQEEKQKARYNEQTKVLISTVLEKDLLAKQPCGFWDSMEGTVPLTIRPQEFPKEEQNVKIWEQMQVSLQGQDMWPKPQGGEEQVPPQGQPDIRNFAMFVLRRRTNRQIRFSNISHTEALKKATIGTETQQDQQANRMFGGDIPDTSVPRLTVLAFQMNGYDPDTFCWNPTEWGIDGKNTLTRKSFFEWKEDSLCKVLVKYFCPVTRNIMMLGVVYGKMTDQIHKLENWVIKRQKATAEKYPDLCRPAPANCKWLCFEEFSNVEIKPVSLNETFKQADLYTGDIIIWQPEVTEPQEVPVGELPCDTVKALAENIANKMTLRIVLHDADELWAIDGITSGPSVWNTLKGGAATPNSDAVDASLQEEGNGQDADGGAAGGPAAASSRSHEFTMDTRQTVSACLQKIADHFGIENVENLWIFRHPPSGYGEEPLSPQRKEEDTNCTLAQLQLPRQITLHAVVVPGFPKKVWREQCAHLIEDHHLARQSNEYVVNPEGKSLSVVVRYFDEAVVERAMTVLQKMPYNITAKEATILALTSFKAEGLDDKDPAQWRLLGIHHNLKGLEILAEDSLLREQDCFRKGNSLYHCLRLEKIAVPEKTPSKTSDAAPEGTTSPGGQQEQPDDATAGPSLICCYHAERSNTSIPFGHPFFLPVFPEDTVPLIKQRVREKLQVPEREFKHWRLGKVTDSQNSMFDAAQRNLLRDEDSKEELAQFLFSANTRNARKICLEHVHPPPTTFGADQKSFRNQKPRGALTIK